jgi:tRNA (guanine37-N1)-methyltransferase
VPDVLLSGHHEKIRRWRRERQFQETALHRPDLLERFSPASDEDRELLRRALADRVAGATRTP